MEQNNQGIFHTFVSSLYTSLRCSIQSTNRRWAKAKAKASMALLIYHHKMRCCFIYWVRTIFALCPFVISMDWVFNVSVLVYCSHLYICIYVKYTYLCGISTKMQTGLWFTFTYMLFASFYKANERWKKQHENFTKLNDLL